MEAIPYLLALYIVLLPIWAVASSPVLLGFVLLARLMRRRAVRSAWAIVAFAIAVSVLAARYPRRSSPCCYPTVWRFWTGRTTPAFFMARPCAPGSGGGSRRRSRLRLLFRWSRRGGTSGCLTVRSSRTCLAGRRVQAAGGKGARRSRR